MNYGRLLLGGALAVLVVSQPAGQTCAQDNLPSTTPTRAEFSKLQADVREQRDLIIQMMQTEQQRYDMVLRLLAGQGGGPPLVTMPAAPETARESAAVESPSKRTRGESEKRSAAIEGKVSLPGGQVGEVYVYVDNAKGPPVRNKTLEIRQEGKQFSPRVAVVQAGTNVVFPNFDSIYHNVFSMSPRNSFDLGSYRSGDKPRSTTLTSPGVVEIFCNMHQKMSADILVVPNAHYVKVRPDGSFRLDNVPVGQRKLVAWGPGAKTAQQKVELTASGAQVSFVLSQREATAHTNKLGQAYGSYRD